MLYYLSVACEVEQGLCLQYLFTAFSLKDDFSEGGISTGEQLTAVRRWKADIFLIAAQEMVHLVQASNLATAAGGTVQLRRPNFPQAPDYYPTHLPWRLDPFSAETIQRYICYERPTDQVLSRMSFGPPIRAKCDGLVDDGAPAPENYAFAHLPPELLRKAHPSRARRAVTIGEMYEAIGEAFLTLPDVIIGPAEGQVDGRLIDFPQVVKVLSRDDARLAVELIIHQGEGTTSDRQDSHFGVFLNIYNQFVAFQKADPGFNPVRPVHPNPLSELHLDNTFPGWRLIDDATTLKVNNLCSSTYETMLLMLYRFFATPSQEGPAQARLFMAFVRIMTAIIKPLGEVLTTRPMGEQTPGFTAGPSFEIDPEVQLLPFAGSAWRYLYDRLLDDASRAAELASVEAIAPQLRAVSATLSAIAQAFGSAPPPSRDT
ncbi:hypothetical protein BWI17_11020 [Betaproteobacteria bacterium GR16-43]|nr:hypothetical protein BWI17_11020 [Betaproteobacteria bacterium GR16-43]